MTEFANLGHKMHQECAKGVEGVQHFQLSTYTQSVNPDYCGCKGFSFRADCKHIKEARELAAKARVCWTDTDPELKQSPQQEFDMTCPRCKGPTLMKRDQE